MSGRAACEAQLPTDTIKPERELRDQALVGTYNYSNASSETSQETGNACDATQVLDGNEDEAELPACDDVRACLFQLLQRKAPGQTITVNALVILEDLLDMVSQ